MNELMRRLNVANTLLDAGDCGSAVKELEAVLERHPECAQAHLSLAIALLGLGHNDAAAAACQTALRLEPASAATQNLWGTLCAERNDHEQAIASFRRALASRENYAIAWHNLANSLHRLGRLEEAAQAYREAVQADPQLVEAAFELAATGNAAAPPAAPLRFVERLFDAYAAVFDRHLTELEYAVPQALADVVEAERSRGPESRLAVLDLGCGTGLAGEALRSIAATLVGVDASVGMLEQARRKHIYDQLIHDELLHYLQESSDRFNLVVAADVFIYLGDLRAAFSGVRRVLHPGGMFAFSIEATAFGNYHLATTRRYQQSPACVEELFEVERFALLASRELNVRVEDRKPITGRVYLLRISV